MSGRIKTEKITKLGLLTTVAVVLGYVEYLVPLTAIPGIKLGLANSVLLYALLLMDTGSAILLMVLKVGLSGLLFGGFSAMIYSFAGGVLSLAAMLLVKKIKGVGTVGISVTGALMHNVGQMAIACFVVESRAILAYMPVLLVSAAVTGTLTGLVAQYSIKAFKHTQKPKKSGKAEKPIKTGQKEFPAKTTDKESNRA